MDEVKFQYDKLKAHFEKQGRKLDLNDSRHRTRLFGAIQREIDKKNQVIQNVRNVLDGQNTYKVIIDSRKK